MIPLGSLLVPGSPRFPAGSSGALSPHVHARGWRVGRHLQTPESPRDPPTNSAALMVEPMRLAKKYLLPSRSGERSVARSTLHTIRGRSVCMPCAPLCFCSASDATLTQGCVLLAFV